MKKQLKEIMLKKRSSLAKAQAEEKSRKIKNNLFNLENYKKSSVIMFFVSFSSEVDTHDMIMQALKKKTVVVPKVANNEIEPSVIVDFKNLIPNNRFGFPEPIDLMKMPYKKIELILVPGIVFDRGGHRIGYGMGYYDRFLKKIPKAFKIGLAFDFQVIDKIPNEEHDVPVDMIITEDGVIDCR